jgi:hypothetical protein
MRTAPRPGRATAATVDPPHPLEALLTPADLATMMHVSTRTLRNWRKRGLLPEPLAHPGRHRLLWPASTIDNWLRSRPAGKVVPHG